MHSNFFLFGVTCVGKDYFIERAMQRHPKVFGAVQVGKEFRRRYPPGHFKGSAAPDHTEKEAFDIFKEQHDKAVADGFEIILISGQPRRVSQVEPVLRYAFGTVIFLNASDQLIEERMRKRFENDKEGFTLAQQRIVNDKIQLYSTIHQLLLFKIEIHAIDVEKDNIDTVIDKLAFYKEL
jgi:hypothetical protein